MADASFRVLVVEQNVRQARLLRDTLIRCGFEVEMRICAFTARMDVWLKDGRYQGVATYYEALPHMGKTARLAGIVHQTHPDLPVLAISVFNSGTTGSFEAPGHEEIYYSLDQLGDLVSAHLAGSCLKCSPVRA